MRIEDVIKQINKYVDELDFVSARRLIEQNIEILQKYKNKLNSNSKELMNILIDRQNNGLVPLSRQDTSILLAVNSYATKFDLRSLKTIVKDKASLFIKPEAVELLNADAKVILSGMGAIHIEQA